MGGFLHTKESPSFPPQPPVIDDLVIILMMLILIMIVTLMMVIIIMTTMMTMMANLTMIITSSESAKEIDLESDLGKKRMQPNTQIFYPCFFIFCFVCLFYFVLDSNIDTNLHLVGILRIG